MADPESNIHDRMHLKWLVAVMNESKRCSIHISHSLRSKWDCMPPSYSASAIFDGMNMTWGLIKIRILNVGQVLIKSSTEKASFWFYPKISFYENNVSSLERIFNTRTNVKEIFLHFADMCAGKEERAELFLVLPNIYKAKFNKFKANSSAI